MALVYRDCVKQTTTSTDTDDLVLDSETAFQGYRTFDDALSDGDTCYYLLDEKVTGQWEIGLGTFTAPSQLARTTVYQSSNGNAKIDLYSGSYPEISIITRAATLQGFEDVINAPAKTSLVAEYEVTGSAATTITFTDLDLNADVGWTIVGTVISTGGTRTDCRLYANGDTTDGNYTTRWLNGSGTTVATNSASAPLVCVLESSASTIGHFNHEYSIVNGYAVFNGQINIYTSGSVHFVKHNIQQTNITQLNFTAPSGNTFAVGSKIKIYRWLV